MSETKKYEKYGQNKPLKKPHYTRTKQIFRAVNELISEGNSNFIPTWDSTDHFHFCCADCNVMADVLQVDFYPYPIDAEGKIKIYALFFWLACEKCGSTGLRKIYLKPTSFMGHHAFTTHGELAFGIEKSAVKVFK